MSQQPFALPIGITSEKYAAHTSGGLDFDVIRGADPTIVDEWSLALIGNASRQTLGAEGISIRGVFDEETRRKPLAFAADAVRYGI